MLAGCGRLEPAVADASWLRQALACVAGHIIPCDIESYLSIEILYFIAATLLNSRAVWKSLLKVSEAALNRLQFPVRRPTVGGRFRATCQRTCIYKRPCEAT